MLSRTSTRLLQMGKSGVDATKLGCVLYMCDNIDIFYDLSKKSCILYLGIVRRKLQYLSQTQYSVVK